MLKRQKILKGWEKLLIFLHHKMLTIIHIFLSLPAGVRVFFFFFLMFFSPRDNNPFILQVLSSLTQGI